MRVTRRMREGVKALRIAICYGEEEAVCEAMQILYPELGERTDADLGALAKAQRAMLMEALEEIHEAFLEIKEA